MVFKRGFLLVILLIVFSASVFSQDFSYNECLSDCQASGESYPKCDISCSMQYEEMLGDSISQEVEDWCIEECMMLEYSTNECTSYCDSYVDRESKFTFSKCYDDCMSNNFEDESFCSDVVCMEEYVNLMSKEGPRDFYSLSRDERKCVNTCIYNDVTPSVCQDKCDEGKLIVESIEYKKTEDVSLVDESYEAAEEQVQEAPDLTLYRQKMQDIHNVEDEVKEVEPIIQIEKESSFGASLVAFFVMFILIVIGIIAYFANSGGSGNIEDRLDSSFNKYRMQRDSFKFELDRFKTSLKNEFHQKKIEAEKFNSVMDKIEKYQEELK